MSCLKAVLLFISLFQRKSNLFITHLQVSELNLLNKSVRRVRSWCAASLNVDAHSEYSTISLTTTTHTPTTMYSSPLTTTPPPELLLLPLITLPVPLPVLPLALWFCSTTPLLRVAVVVLAVVVAKVVEDGVVEEASIVSFSCWLAGGDTRVSDGNNEKYTWIL